MSSVKSFVTLKEKFDRIIVLIDMDCFYCQVEEYLNPKDLAGKPIAVVQYLENAGIIAVNYAARDLGVTRHMREREAKAVCEELICVKVPSKNGKADLTKYRDAGLQVAKVLQTFTPLLERASVDEAYLDITENVAEKIREMRDNKFQLLPSSFANTYAVGYENIGRFVQDVTSSVDEDFGDIPEEDRKAVASSKLRLLIGAAIVNDIRKAVKEQTKYECSAGIAHNKILAKLTCGMNKPNKQTILPIESVSGLFRSLAVSKVKNLGGKLGEEVCEKLNAKTMEDLLKFTEAELQNHFQPRVGSWLYYMARGIDLEKVTPKFLSKSIAVSKNFRGKNEISSIHTLKFWLKELAKEVVERLGKDALESNRFAKHMIVVFTQGAPKVDTSNVSSTRTVQLNGNSLNSYTAEQIADEAYETIKKNSKQFLKAEGTVVMHQSVKHLGISASKFEDNSAPSTSNNLQNLLKNHKKSDTKKSPAASKEKKEPATIKSLKNFEMKSPKSMFAKAIIPKDDKKVSTVDQVEAVEALSVSQNFTGDFAIRGIKSLKHWITQIFDQLCSNLIDESDKHNRSPSTIQLKFAFMSESRTKTKEIKVPLESFADKIINVNLIVELVLKSEEFLTDGTLMIKLPITQLKVIPSDFKIGQKWNYNVKIPSQIKTPIPETIDDTELCEPELMESDDDKLEEEELVEEQTNPQTTEFESSPFYDFSEESEDSKVENDASTSTNYTKAVDETPEAMNISESAETELDASYSQFQPKALPNDFMEMLNPKETCMQCGKMIGRLDMGSHADHHLALQIATEQREEYRKQLKSKSPSTSTQGSAKKIKKPPAKVNSIVKYTVKNDESLELPDDSKVKCSECSKFFSPDDYVCHLDYHYAKKIRDQELKQASISQPKVEPKRKKSVPSQKQTSKVISVKTFFATGN